MRWAWLLLVCLVPAAAGHAEPWRTEPASLTGLPDAPTWIEVEFNEPLVESESVIAIFDEDLLRRDTGNSSLDPDDRTTVRLYTGNLRQGVYTVSFETRSAVDGHLERGSIPLTIGVPFRGDVEDPYVWANVEVPWLESALRLAGYIGLAGLLAYDWRGRGDSTAWLHAAGGTHALASLGLLWQAPAGSTLSAMLMLRFLLGGMWWVAAQDNGRLARGFGALTVGVAAGAGHANGEPLAWIAQGVHVYVLLAWAGGLVWMAWRRDGDWRRFSRLATISAAALVVTGITLSMLRLQSPPDIWRTAYGQAISFKIAAAAAMLALGAVSHMAVRNGRVAGLARRSAWEGGIAVAIVVATAVLATLPVPADRAPPAPTYEDASWWGDHHVTLTVTPGVERDGEVVVRPGDHDLRVRIVHRDDGPVTGARVEARFLHRVLDLGAIRTPMEALGDGWYGTSGTQLGSIGTWEVRILFEGPTAPAGAEAWFDVDLGEVGHFHGSSQITDPHFDTGYLAPGASFSRVFGDQDVGRFACHCHPHQWMECEVVVDPRAPPVNGTIDVLMYGDADEDLGFWRFEPAQLHIPPGTQVRWTNVADIEHTATNVRWYPTA